MLRSQLHAKGRTSQDGTLTATGRARRDVARHPVDGWMDSLQATTGGDGWLVLGAVAQGLPCLHMFGPLWPGCPKTGVRYAAHKIEACDWKEGISGSKAREEKSQGPSKGQAGQAGGREPGSSREALPVWKEPGPLTIIHWMIGLSLSGCGLAPQGGRWREDTPSRLPLSPVRSGAPVQPFACPARARGAWVVPSNKPTWAPRQQSASTFARLWQTSFTVAIGACGDLCGKSEH